MALTISCPISRLLQNMNVTNTGRWLFLLLGNSPHPLALTALQRPWQVPLRRVTYALHLYVKMQFSYFFSNGYKTYLKKLRWVHFILHINLKSYFFLTLFHKDEQDKLKCTYIYIWFHYFYSGYLFRLLTWHFDPLRPPSFLTLHVAIMKWHIIGIYPSFFKLAQRFTLDLSWANDFSSLQFLDLCIVRDMLV